MKMPAVLSGSSLRLSCFGACTDALDPQTACLRRLHEGTVGLYQQQLATALVLCLVSVGQSDNPKQAALSVLHQLLQIQHDSLASDTDGQGSQCMSWHCGVHLCMEGERKVPLASLRQIVSSSDGESRAKQIPG